MFFDAENEEEVAGDFGPLADGEYPVIIVSAENCMTKDEHGNYVKIRFDVVSGKGTGRCVFINYNLGNDKYPKESDQPQYLKIGRSDFKKLCLTTEVKNIKTADEVQNLVDRTLNIKIRSTKNGDYTNTNILEYKPYVAATEETPVNADAIPF